MTGRQQQHGAVASPWLEGRHGMITAQNEQRWGDQQIETMHLDGKQQPKVTPAENEPETQGPFPHNFPALPVSSWWGPTETQSTKRSDYSENTGLLLGWRSEGGCVRTRCTECLQILPNSLSRVSLLYHHVELAELAKS